MIRGDDAAGLPGTRGWGRRTSGRGPLRPSILILAVLGCVEGQVVEMSQGVLELREDLAIGSLASETSTDFGELVELALTSQGGVVVHDIYASTVLQFDERGHFIGRVGRAGQGPGEHDGVLGLVGLEDGSIAVYSSDQRLIVYHPDGGFHGRRLPWRLGGDAELTLAGGNLLLQAIAVPGSDRHPTQYRYIELDRSLTALDSLQLPEIDWIHEAQPGQSGIQPKKFEVPTSSGWIVTGVSSRPTLRFATADGAVIQREFSWPAVPLQQAELAAWERDSKELRERSGRPERFPPPPRTKPVFSRLVATGSGTVWVVLAAPSIGPDLSVPEVIGGLTPTPRWLAPFRAVEVDNGGEVLREVTGPIGFELRAANGDQLWGYRRGEFGEQYIVRMVVPDS